MIGRFSRGRAPAADYWPGFVDALASLLLVLIFLLSFFFLSHVFLSEALSGRTDALARLEAKVADLTAQLDLEQAEKAELTQKLSTLRATLGAAETAEGGLSEAEKSADAETLRDALRTERKLSAAARDEVELLNQQLAELRKQIFSLQDALEASEARDREAQAKIVDLGKRLNAALAQKVQELARYRSEFFGRLRTVLDKRSDIEVVGDRFVFQSEVLFDSGSAEINPDGRRELKKLAGALKEIDAQIPDDISWVLRVDGHSDKQKISTRKFPSNWHLSSARAIAVVRFLVSQGIPAERLAATGFGEHQPLDQSESPAAYRRNRRIELKLTER
ncbi:MAG: peptidoglycan -binding protein [Alphaproteobacteria bacterium]